MQLSGGCQSYAPSPVMVPDTTVPFFSSICTFSLASFIKNLQAGQDDTSLSKGLHRTTSGVKGAEHAGSQTARYVTTEVQVKRRLSRVGCGKGHEYRHSAVPAAVLMAMVGRLPDALLLKLRSQTLPCLSTVNSTLIRNYSASRGAEVLNWGTRHGQDGHHALHSSSKHVQMGPTPRDHVMQCHCVAHLTSFTILPRRPLQPQAQVRWRSGSRLRWLLLS